MTSTIIGAGQTSSGAMLGSGDRETVVDGGTSFGTTIDFAGAEVVSAGGAASGTVVDEGDVAVYAGGTASATTIDDGYLFVYAGGVADGTVVNQVGQLVVSSGGTAAGVVTSGFGSVSVAAGGMISGVTLDGGQLTLGDGGSVAGTIILSGLINTVTVRDATPAGATIVGLGPEDTIVLGNLPFGAGDTIAVFGDLVSVTAPGAGTDVLDIAGAVAGSFVLGRAAGLDSGQVQLTVLPTLSGGSGGGATAGGGVSSVSLVGPADTITAGPGTTVVYASGASAEVDGGSGRLVFVAGGGSYDAGGGAGTGLLYGGSGSDLLRGGAGAGSVLVAGSGNTTLLGGQGSAVAMFGGAGGDMFYGSNSGGDTMVGGAGGNSFALTDRDLAYGGAGSTDTFDAAGVSSLVVEGAGATRVNLVGGSVTVFAGAGADSYTLTKYDEVHAAVVGFKAGDLISLDGVFTAADAKAALAGATTGAFGTTLAFGDGSSLTLFGVTPAGVRISAG